MLLHFAIILIFTLANGLFALAEIAIVSAKRARLRRLAADGNTRAAAALALAESPGRFLSTIQLGITLVGVVTSVFGGATVAESLAPWFENLPYVGQYAFNIAVGVVVVTITLLSVILGELVPKRIALTRPERYAMLVAKPMQLLARIGSPVIASLSAVTDGILRVLGVSRVREAAVSEEEVTLLIEQGLPEGVFLEQERRMVESVLSLDRMHATAIMTPRPKIVWLDSADPDEVNWRKIVTSNHSHFPVCRGGLDHIVGMIAVKALWANSAAGFNTPMRDLLTKPLYVPETTSGAQLLESFKRTGRHIALVTDEFGTISGLVTLIDVLEAIVGALPTRGQTSGHEARQRPDGSWLIDATMPLGDLKELLKTPVLPSESRGDFQTLGGFVLTHFGRIPVAGDTFDAGGFRWEVVDMDRFRVDKVLVTPLPPAADDATEDGLEM